MEKFKKQNEETLLIFEQVIKNIECERKKMFGYSVGFINGNMVAGIFADRIFFRVKIENQEKIKEKNKSIKDFEPVDGRKMKDYLEIKGKKENIELLMEYVKMAAELSKELPKKVKEKK
jgi:TfoX/Sxy family transcriptional regulator of competence genes